jgi:hypothetical protein
LEIVNDVIFVANDSKHVAKINRFGHVEKLADHPKVFERMPMPNLESSFPFLHLFAFIPNSTLAIRKINVYKISTGSKLNPT